MAMMVVGLLVLGLCLGSGVGSESTVNELAEGRQAVRRCKADYSDFDRIVDIPGLSIVPSFLGDADRTLGQILVRSMFNEDFNKLKFEIRIRERFAVKRVQTYAFRKPCDQVRDQDYSHVAKEIYYGSGKQNVKSYFNLDTLPSKGGLSCCRLCFYFQALFYDSDGKRVRITEESIRTENGYVCKVGGRDRIYCDLPDICVNIVHGTRGDDVIHGTEGRDYIYGLDGNDKIYGKGGDDAIHGDDGDDMIFGGEGDDVIHGGYNDDMIFGGEGDDRLDAGYGYDRLYGEGGVDYLRGGMGNDYLKDESDDGPEGEFDNIFVSNYGADIFIGGAGDDSMYSRRGNHVMRGYGGDDRMFILYGGGSFYGGDGDDVIIGGLEYDIIEGGAGNDRLEGGASRDHIHGGPGDDELHGNRKGRINDGDGDYLYGEEGDDYLTGEKNRDLLDGGSGNNKYLTEDGMYYG